LPFLILKLIKWKKFV